MSIIRKAKALGYPHEITTNNQIHLAALLFWLECEKLQHYNAEKRQVLKDGLDSDWPEYLHKYAAEFQCPKNITTVEGEVDWILSYAIQRSYEKQPDKYNKYSLGNLKSSNVPNVVVANVLDNLDFTSKEFQEGINKLGKLLNMPPHNDPSVLLKACATLIEARLHKDALDNPNNYIVSGMPFPYKEADPGFDISDEAVMEAAKVLRLLYINDLRNLQTKVNECIVAVQSVTANPKTDTALGQVGR